MGRSPVTESTNHSVTADPVLEDPDNFIALARNCWLVDYSARRTRRLHAVTDGTWTGEHRQSMAEHWIVVIPVRLACGRVSQRLGIAGVFDRLDGERCKSCCKATGLPPGLKAPVNDPACRVLLGLDPKPVASRP